jgi:L-cysteine desulfidase
MEGKMNKAIISIIFLTLMIACPAYSQNFKVKTVDENSKEVVLQDKDTGEEWLAREGDEVEGWRIMAITKDHVTIAKINQEMESVMTQLPVKGGGRLIELNPQPLGQ